MAVTEYERERIAAAYESSQGMAKRAVALLKEEEIYVTEQTISKYWKRDGLARTKKRGGDHGGTGKSLSKDEIRIIMRGYDLYDGSAALAAKSLPYSPETISKNWRQGIAAGIIRPRSDLEKIVE